MDNIFNNERKFLICGCISVIFLFFMIIPTLYAISEKSVNIIINSPYQVRPGDSLKIFVSVTNEDGLTDLQNVSVLQTPLPQKENPIIIESIEVDNPFTNVSAISPIGLTLFSTGEAILQKKSLRQELIQRIVSENLSLEDIQPYIDRGVQLTTFIDDNTYKTILELQVPENIPNGSQYTTVVTVNYLKNGVVKSFTKQINFTVTSTDPMRAVIIVVDGSTRDAMYQYALDNPTGNISQLISNGIKVDEAKTVFPSITPASHSSIFTGVYPDKHRCGSIKQI